MRDFTDLMKMDLEPKGVMVQASTLGALEALMQFLRKECDPPIPVFAVGIGAVFKKDVMRASIMNEKVGSYLLFALFTGRSARCARLPRQFFAVVVAFAPAAALFVCACFKSTLSCFPVDGWLRGVIV